MHQHKHHEQSKWQESAVLCAMQKALHVRVSYANTSHARHPKSKPAYMTQLNAVHAKLSNTHLWKKR